MNNGTITMTGNITWPSTGVYTVPPNYPGKTETLIRYAGEILQALIARELSQINTNEELVERAWKLAFLMLAEGQKHGVNLY